MRRIHTIAGAGLLCACLAGWAALALAQPPAKLPDIPESAPVAGRVIDAPPAPESGPAPAPIPERVSVGTPSAPPVAGSSMPALPSAPRGVGAAEPPATSSSSMPSSAPRGFGASEPATEATENTGKQEPAVSLEWVGPPTAKVGQPSEYSLVVRNTCNVPVQQVTVRVRVPAGLAVAASEPKATNEGGMLTWELGTLVARQEKNLLVKMTADTKGDVAAQAWVTFTGSTSLRIRVREPKLTVKCQAQDKVMVGDPAAFTLTVSNPGDGSADQVKIHAILSEGLEHARGNKIDFDIGNLAAGESRNVTLLCATRTGGLQKCDATAEADCGLSAKDSVGVNVIMPRLDLTLSGPHLRYLERKALYTLKVTNPGDAAATNVTVADMVPTGFKVLAASDGGRHDFQTRTVSWFLGEIGPGQTRTVQLEAMAVSIGDQKHKATAVGARGLRAESEMVTKVEGVSALAVELIDTEDPIEVNGETAYEVRVTNTGSKTETDIRLVATLPDKMSFKAAQGPARYQERGKQVVFEPIEKLAPRADAIFRISVKALEAGSVSFKIGLTSTNLTEPIIKMEPTRIYSDAPENATTSTPGATQSGSPQSSTTPVSVPAEPQSPPPSTPPVPAPPVPAGTPTLPPPGNGD
jgi:uncharacterized repeat protein (TIGR01451 family)